MAACTPATGRRTPSSLRGYEILVERHDTLGDHLAAGLRRHGFTVRRRLKGGSPPTAVLISFTFHEATAPGGGRYDAWLADTRTGAVVAAVSIPLDSLGASPEATAQAVVASLVAQLAPHPPVSPP